MNHEQRLALKNDPCVESIVHCYSAVHDWIENAPIVQRGSRTVERLVNISEQGIVPLADRYFRFVLEREDVDTDIAIETEDVISSLQDDLYPDYVKQSEEHNFSEYNKSLVRKLVDSNLRLGNFAIRAGQDINRRTDHYRHDEISEEFADEIDVIWKDWWNRLNDLYWERRYKLSHDVLRKIEKGNENPDQIKFENEKEAYPEFPNGTVINGEKIWN